MKLVCPQCKKEAKIEIVMVDCTISQTIKFNPEGEPKYGIPKIRESLRSHYQCNACGWHIPVEPDFFNDNTLLKWLETQQQVPDSPEDYAEMLFQTIRKTDHTAVKFCNWLLDLREKQNIPPCGLSGFCSTTYTDSDPAQDKDLRMICRDLARHALASEPYQAAPLDKNIYTAPDMEHLEE